VQIPPAAQQLSGAFDMIGHISSYFTPLLRFIYKLITTAAGGDVQWLRLNASTMGAEKHHRTKKEAAKLPCQGRGQGRGLGQKSGPVPYKKFQVYI